jgi:type II restriction enzyme
MANSEFLTNKEQGDWAETIVFKAVNEYSGDYFAVKYGRSESIAAGDDGFANFYAEYQSELNGIGKRPDILIFKVRDFPDGSK